MNYHCDCEKCGRRTTAYTLHLNRALCVAFLKFSDARVRLRRPVSKGELDLTNGEYGNFQNLRHFGIVAQADKAGPWDFTPLGLEFLAGRVTLPTPVAHMGGVTMDQDDLAWQTHKGSRTRKGIRDILPDEWKARSEYQLEKRDLVA